MRPVAFAALALLAALAPAQAADPTRGETLAKRWCAACHLVAPDQNRATPDTPSFAAIARREDAPPLPAFLAMSHPRMPDMGLSRAEIADLAAFIKTKAP
jgi:mono/diheme cytochrome c family protein